MTQQDTINSLQIAFNDRRYDTVYEIFRNNFGFLHRDNECCFLVGVSLYHLGKYELSIQYLHHAHLARNQLNANILLTLVDAYDKVKDYQSMLNYASLLYDMIPNNDSIFSRFQQARIYCNLSKIRRWLVIGDSHVRYFRFMQLNKNIFFKNAIYLDTIEIAGASAYGLGNSDSKSGALNYIGKQNFRIKLADGVIINFGEIDCRRSAWKAAFDKGVSIEECIENAAIALLKFVRDRISPLNKNIIILGAKPQIIGDEDHYRNSLEDDRIIFQSIYFRQKITLLFNDILRKNSELLGFEFFSLDNFIRSELNNTEFEKYCFWDDYKTDTHGNTPYFAKLYYDVLERRLNRNLD